MTRAVPRRSPGPALAVLAALGVLVALAGCGLVDTMPKERLTDNKRIAGQIADQVRRGDPAIVRGSGAFTDDAYNYREVSFRFDCRGCDLSRVADQALRALWSSELAPIGSISVRVTNTATRRDLFRDFSLPGDEATLTRRYGERPASTRAWSKSP